MTQDRFHVQVRVRDGYRNEYVWRRVHPVGGDPYVFTRQEAIDYIFLHNNHVWDGEAFRLEELPALTKE